jgi:transposase
MNLDFSQSAPRVRTLDEAQTLIEALWLLVRDQAALIERQTQEIADLKQRIQVLEEKLNANSRNSSRPPSSDANKGKPAKPRAGSGRRPGGQPGHAGQSRTLLPPEQVTHTHACHPESTCRCGGVVRLSHLAWRHQVIDLPAVTAEVTEYRLYAGVCQACGRCHEAVLPPGISARVAGPRLLALMGTLTGGYRLSKRLVQSLLQDLFGIELSVGAISESEAVLAAALAPAVEQAQAHVRQAPVVCADETGHREQAMAGWMWVAIAGLVSVFLARASRSAQVARELLGAGFAGILVSDRYAGYAWIEASRRQVCWSHLLRDFTKISERSGEAGRIGDELLAHAHHMFGFWRRVRDGTLSRDRFACHMLFLQDRIEAALRRGSACAELRTAHTCQQILKLKESLWTFVSTPGVEPTNNLSERCLRHYVIWRKICYGTQSSRGSLYMERMMTVVGSCKLQGRNLLEFVTQSVRAHWGRGVAPSLIPVVAT